MPTPVFLFHLRGLALFFRINDGRHGEQHHGRIYLKVMKALHTKALATVISVALYSAAFLGMAAFIEQHHGCQNGVRNKRGKQQTPPALVQHRLLMAKTLV